MIEPRPPSEGDASAVAPAAVTPAEALPFVYAELRRLAAAYMKEERDDHTLQPTALVHEAYLKLSGRTDAIWNDPVHFRAVAATAMRQILVDHARQRATAKRGGDWLRVTLNDAVTDAGDRVIDFLALDDAMNELAAMDERKGRVSELRLIGGLTCAEVARTLSIPLKTAEGDWYMARAWLRQQLSKAGD